MTKSRFLQDINELNNRWVGLDQFLLQLPSTFSNPPYPPYNIERTNDDRYRIVVALAGFTAAKINVELVNGELVIQNVEDNPTSESSTDVPVPEEINYIHKGIATRSFTLKFHLSPEIVVDDSTFIDGLLTINMHREVPESKKPRLIKIN